MKKVTLGIFIIIISLFFIRCSNHTLSKLLRSGDTPPLFVSKFMTAANLPTQLFEVSRNFDISFPNSKREVGMRLFTFNVNDTGKIAWINPVPLAGQNQIDKLSKGKLIFTKKCAACHDIEKDGKAPPLAFITHRREWNWLKVMSLNDSALIDKSNAQTCYVYNKYGQKAMGAYKTLTVNDIKAIFEYIDREATQKGLTISMIPDWKPTFDSCERIGNKMGQYWAKIDSLNAIKANNEQTFGFNQALDFNSFTIVNNNFTHSFNDSITEYEYVPYYYYIKVRHAGWDDIHKCFTHGDSLSNVQIDLHIDDKLKIPYLIYIVVPDEKIFAKVFSTDERENTIKLFDGRANFRPGGKAILFAFGERDGELAFGMNEFTINQKTETTITIDKADENTITKVIASFKLDNFSIDFEKPKNDKEIRANFSKIKSMEKILSKSCNYWCGRAAAANLATAAVPVKEVEK